VLHLPRTAVPHAQLSLSVQICTLVQYGPGRWLSAWNIIDICTYVFQILISIAYFGRCAALAPLRSLRCAASAA
jgi:hypothetical protein